MEVDSGSRQNLLDVLVRYKLRRPLSIEDASGAWEVRAAIPSFSSVSPGASGPTPPSPGRMVRHRMNFP